MPSIPDLSGLDGLSMDTLLSGPSAGDDSHAQGKPLEIPLDDIIEDPDQPRKNFDHESLKELAESVKRQGLLMPIAVRPRPDGQPGFMIIAGARRYRAFRLAGMATIPAFIGNGGDRYAQMAENIHRDNLSHNEIAAFIAAELSQGKKQVEIAQNLGKSKAYVSRYAALADSPDWIKGMIADGRCNDIKIISAIIKRAESDGDLERKLADEAEVTKATFAALDVSTGNQASTLEPAEASAGWSSATASDTDNPGADFGQLGFMQPAIQDSDSNGFPLQDLKSGEDTESEDYKESSDTVPNLTIPVYVGGRKGYLQNKKLKVYFEDNGEMASIAPEDVSFQ